MSWVSGGGERNILIWFSVAWFLIIDKQGKLLGFTVLRIYLFCSGRLSWEQVLKYACLRKKYISLYASLLKSDLSRDVVDGNKDIEELDRELDIELILQWRYPLFLFWNLCGCWFIMCWNCKGSYQLWKWTNFWNHRMISLRLYSVLSQLLILWIYIFWNNWI